MALTLFITNTTTNARGARVPDIPAGTPWIGNLYQKQGNVFKYLLGTTVDLTGLPGVIGPITPEQIQAALDADGAQTLRGWTVDSVPGWALNGVHV